MNAIDKMFEVAVRGKFRFPFRGLISVEDLWDLSVEDLDKIFKSLNSEIKKAKEESLLDVKTQEETALDLRIQVVKYIVGVKLTEKEKRENEREQSAKKQKVMEILARKQDSELEGKSIEELQEMLNQ